MALDIYVGPLSRYHAGNWETCGQRAAREQGIPLVTMQIGAGQEEDDEPLPQSVVTEDLHRWQEGLCKGMASQGIAIEPWLDEPEMPYETDRPGWVGLAGLIYKYAYLLRPELEQPAIVPSLNESEKDRAFQGAMREPNLFFILAECQLWLPASFEAMFQVQTLAGQDMNMSSLHMLNLAINKMCEMWGMNRGEVEQASTSQPGPDATLDEAAFHGLAVFARLATLSGERRVPMILDF